MRKRCLILILVVVTILSIAAWADDPNAILSKEDSASIFSLSEAQWITNVEIIKASKIGEYKVAPTGEYTLYIRSDISSGLLAVSPSYKPNDRNRPWKISVTVIADTPASSAFYRGMEEVAVEDLLHTAMREMSPEFSIMGYMVRSNSETPSIHFTIFRKNDFPPIDMLNKMGHVCPTQHGKKSCVRTRMIGSE